MYEREVNQLLRQHAELDSISTLFQNYQIKNDFEVKDLLGKSKNIGSIITTNKIVIYYPENVCKDCIKYEIEHLKFLLNSHDKQKLTLLGEFASKSHFKQFFSELNLDISATFISPQKRLLGNGDCVWIMLVDNNLRIKKIFPLIKNNYPK
jgi:hypothetical protein